MRIILRSNGWVELKQDRPIPTPEQEEELLLSAQNGSIQARNDLIDGHLPFIIATAHAYYRHRSDAFRVQVDDLIQTAIIGMIHAIRKFDMSRGLRLTTYARQWMWEYMNNAMYDAKLYRVCDSTLRNCKLGTASPKTVEAVERFRDMALTDEFLTLRAKSMSAGDEAAFNEQVEIMRHLTQEGTTPWKCHTHRPFR